MLLLLGYHLCPFPTCKLPLFADPNMSSEMKHWSSSLVTQNLFGFESLFPNQIISGQLYLGFYFLDMFVVTSRPRKPFKLFFASLGSSTEFCNRVLRLCRRNCSKNRQQQQELSLGLTLVTISILFILCQSVKIVPDLYERFCRSKGITSTSISGEVTCHSTKFIDTLIR